MSHSLASHQLNKHHITGGEVVDFLRYHAAGLKLAARNGVIALGAFGLLNGAAWMLTYGRVMPFARINGVNYGWQTTAAAERKLRDHHQVNNLTLSLDGRAIQINAQAAGVQVLGDQTFGQARSGLRSLPLFEIAGNLLNNYQPVYTVDQTKLVEALKAYIPESRVEPVSAAAVIPANPAEAVRVTPETSGQLLNAQVAANQVADQAANNTFALRISPSTLPARWTAADFAAFLPQIEAARKVTLTINAGGREVSISGAELQELLAIDTEGDQLAVVLARDKLAQYFANRADRFYTAPIATRVSLRDGVEVSRQDGTAGGRLDTDKTAEVVATAFRQGILVGEAVFAPVNPNVVYSRSYSNTDTGLYKLIEAFAASHAGRYRVAAVQLTGEGNRSAFYNADTAVIPASTYKVFVAYLALSKIESGQWAFSDSTNSGSVDHCLTVMIVVSDNACGHALITKLGWAETDNLLRAKGFGSTKLNNSDGSDMKTTASEEMKLLTGLYNKELLTQASRDHLFGLMGRQIYRKGIVAGSNGAEVSDKVGVLYDNYHDMGIVYSPKATYALVIMTEGAGGYNNIRLLAGQIYDFYNQ